MPEVEGDRVRARLYQVQLLEPAQPVVDDRRVELADSGQQVELEGPADDGARVRDPARGPVQRLGAGQHRVGQRVGDREVRDPVGSGPARCAARPPAALGVQRDAVAAVVDRGHDPLRGGVAEQDAGQGGGLGEAEARQPESPRRAAG